MDTHSRSFTQNINNWGHWTLKNKHIDKTYLYAKDPYQVKHQLIIRKREGVGLKHYNDSKFIRKYSSNTNNKLENVEEYKPNKERKILIVFDDINAGMLRNKKSNTLVTVLFIRCRKVNIYSFFITQSYFAAPKNRLNSVHYFFLKISNKCKL